MSLWPKQEHLCHSGALLALLTITTDKHERLCLNIVYRHRWALLHLGSLCLGLLLGSRRPFGLRSGCERREGERGISAGWVGAFWHSSNSWLLFWWPVSHVYLCLLLSLCCGLTVGTELRLGWTVSREKGILQKTQRCCFSRAELCESHQETVLNLPLLLPPEKVMFSVLSHPGKVENFALSTFWADISMKASVRGLGFLSGHAFLLTALWVVHGWEDIQSSLRQLNTLLLSQKHQVSAWLCLLFENHFCPGLAPSSHLYR